MAHTTLELPAFRDHGRSRRPRQSRTINGALLVVGRDDDTVSGALRIAELLARRNRVNAHVLTLVESLPFTASLLAKIDSAALEEGRRQEQLVRMRRRVHQTVGQSVYFSTSADLAGPGCEVDRVVRRRDSALIITGFATRGAPERAASEDVVLQMARTVAVPLLAVTTGATQLPRRALVAVDFGEASVRAARAAVRTMANKGTLTLAHAAPALGVGVPRRDGYDEVYAEGLTMLFSRLSLELRASRGIEVETLPLRGDPASALVALLADHDFDLVAAGTRSTPRSGTHFTGCVSTALVRGTAHSVLLASPQEVR